LTTVRDLALWDENFHTAGIGGRALVDDLQRPGSLNDGTRSAMRRSGDRQYRGLNTVFACRSDAGYRAI